MLEVAPEVRKRVHHLYCMAWAAKGMEEHAWKRYAEARLEDYRWESDQETLEDRWLYYVNCRALRMTANRWYRDALVISGLPYWEAFHE